MSGDKSLKRGGFNINPVDIIMYLLSKVVLVCIGQVMSVGRIVQW